MFLTKLDIRLLLIYVETWLGLSTCFCYVTLIVIIYMYIILQISKMTIIQNIFWQNIIEKQLMFIRVKDSYQ